MTEHRDPWQRSAADPSPDPAGYARQLLEDALTVRVVVSSEQGMTGGLLTRVAPQDVIWVLPSGQDTAVGYPASSVLRIEETDVPSGPEQ